MKFIATFCMLGGSFSGLSAAPALPDFVEKIELPPFPGITNAKPYPDAMELPELGVELDFGKSTKPLVSYMPVIAPNKEVHYSALIQKPAPGVSYKLLVREVDLTPTD